ncbi:hypothetical protein J2X69_002478 [Algoriphagus sp. 4150]|nr:hypothetical protein [Algoriphagus sp. 4150]
MRLISTKMVDAGIYNHAPVCRAPVMDISSVYKLSFPFNYKVNLSNAF